MLRLLGCRPELSTEENEEANGEADAALVFGLFDLPDLRALRSKAEGLTFVVKGVRPRLEEEVPAGSPQADC